MALVLCLLTIPFVGLAEVRAEVWYVDADGTPGVDCDCVTIAACADSASVGDTVLVACGTYYEHDILLNPGATLRSETGQADCVTIDAQGQGRVLWCLLGMPDTSIRIEGFTITGGVAETEGAGMFSAAWVTNIANCTFLGNSTQSRGGGLFCYESVVTLSSCVFSGNSAGAGGGVACDMLMPLTAHDCLFVNNTGGAVHCSYSSQPTIRSCTFVGNAGGSGSAVHFWETWLTLENSILAFNHGKPVGGTSHCTVGLLACCDVYGNEGGDWVGIIEEWLGVEGNISECPLFCDPEKGDFWLQECSLCAPGNHPDGYPCGLIGALDVGCECGEPSAVERSTWGAVKGMYR